MTEAELTERVEQLIAEGHSPGQALTLTYPNLVVVLTTDHGEPGERVATEPREAMPGLDVATWQAVRDRLLAAPPEPEPEPEAEAE